MKIVRLLLLLVLAICLPSLFAQAPDAQKDAAPPKANEPLIVDVHASPYRPRIVYTTNVAHGRFDMRNATILDMIAMAYSREDVAIFGGPIWIAILTDSISRRRCPN